MEFHGKMHSSQTPGYNFVELWKKVIQVIANKSMSWPVSLNSLKWICKNRKQNQLTSTFKSSKFLHSSICDKSDNEIPSKISRQTILNVSSIFNFYKCSECSYSSHITFKRKFNHDDAKICFMKEPLTLTFSRKMRFFSVQTTESKYHHNNNFFHFFSSKFLFFYSQKRSSVWCKLKEEEKNVVTFAMRVVTWRKLRWERRKRSLSISKKILCFFHLSLHITVQK